MDKYTLKQYQTIVREIEQLEAEKQRVLDEYLAPKLLTGMPGSSTSLDKIGDVVARQDKFQRLIDAKLDQLLELREHIEAAIEGLPPNDRLLLRLRYIDGLTWEQVAVELHYGYQWTLKRHGRILQRLK